MLAPRWFFLGSRVLRRVHKDTQRGNDENRDCKVLWRFGRAIWIQSLLVSNAVTNLSNLLYYAVRAISNTTCTRHTLAPRWFFNGSRVLRRVHKDTQRGNGENRDCKVLRRYERAIWMKSTQKACWWWWLFLMYSLLMFLFVVVVVLLMLFLFGSLNFVFNFLTILKSIPPICSLRPCEQYSIQPVHDTR